jgi:hypothetical protein
LRKVALLDTLHMWRKSYGWLFANKFDNWKEMIKFLKRYTNEEEIDNPHSPISIKEIVFVFLK